MVAKAGTGSYKQRSSRTCAPQKKERDVLRLTSTTSRVHVSAAVSHRLISPAWPEPKVPCPPNMTTLVPWPMPPGATAMVEYRRPEAQVLCC